MTLSILEGHLLLASLVNWHLCTIWSVSQHSLSHRSLRESWASWFLHNKHNCVLSNSGLSKTHLNNWISISAVFLKHQMPCRPLPSWVPNSSQITEELQMMSFDNALIETKTAICTSLKFNFSFRFHWPLIIKSTLLNLSSVWNFVPIHWTTWWLKPPNCQNRNLQISKK